MHHTELNAQNCFVMLQFLTHWSWTQPTENSRVYFQVTTHRTSLHSYLSINKILILSSLHLVCFTGMLVFIPYKRYAQKKKMMDRASAANYIVWNKCIDRSSTIHVSCTPPIWENSSHRTAAAVTVWVRIIISHMVRQETAHPPAYSHMDKYYYCRG